MTTTVNQVFSVWRQGRCKGRTVSTGHCCFFGGFKVVSCQLVLRKPCVVLPSSCSLGKPNFRRIWTVSRFRNFEVIRLVDELYSIAPIFVVHIELEVSSALANSDVISVWRPVCALHIKGVSFCNLNSIFFDAVYSPSIISSASVR